MNNATLKSTNSTSDKIRNLSAGDAAVQGLIGGLLAGIVMALYLLAAGLSAGVAPGELLSSFSLGGAPSALQGALTHLGVASFYGLVFGLLWKLSSSASGLRRVPLWLGGLLYGAGLLLLAQVLILPQAGAGLKHIPGFHFAIAHAVYGVVLGLSTGRSSG